MAYDPTFDPYALGVAVASGVMAAGMHATALAGGGGGVEVEGVEQNEVAEVSRNDLIRHARWRQPHYYSVWDFPSARAART